MRSAKDLSCDVAKKYAFVIMAFTTKPKLLIIRLAQLQQEEKNKIKKITAMVPPQHQDVSGNV